MGIVVKNSALSAAIDAETIPAVVAVATAQHIVDLLANGQERAVSGSFRLSRTLPRGICWKWSHHAAYHACLAALAKPPRG